MQISWLGTASLLIETQKSKILFDPYLRKFQKDAPPFPFGKISDADAIFITHPHFDHFADIPEILPRVTCDVYTNARGVKTAKKRRFDLARIKSIDFGNELTFGDITVKAYRGRHVRFDKTLALRTVKRVFCGHFRQGLKVEKINRKFGMDLDNDIFAYLVTAENKSVLIFGSAGCDPDTRYPAPDLLVYPYQGRTDILEYSLGIVKKISPKKILCDHFDDAFPPITAQINPADFKTAAENGLGIPIDIPDFNKPITV